MAKSLSRHYPTVLEQKQPSKEFRNYSQTYLTLKSKFVDVEKVLLVAKQAQVHAENARGAGIAVTQIYTKKPETLPVTFAGSLCKTHDVLCSKMADVHGLEVHDNQT